MAVLRVVLRIVTAPLHMRWVEDIRLVRYRCRNPETNAAGGGTVYHVMVREALVQGLTMRKTRDVCLQGAADRNKEVRRRNEGADGRGV